MAVDMQSKANLFSDLVKWRLKTGRCPRTGRKRSQLKRENDFDAVSLTIVGLKLAAQATHREDLRPAYTELAEFLESIRQLNDRSTGS